MMRYSGKGDDQSKEKADRKDIYNPIGGHVEKGEDIIESAQREAVEEAGIKLLNPKVRGIIHIDGFAGKDIVNFIIVGTAEDEPVKSSLEGELEWVKISDIPGLNVFKDIQPILDKLLSLKLDEMFTGVAGFNGFELKTLKLHIR